MTNQQPLFFRTHTYMNNYKIYGLWFLILIGIAFSFIDIGLGFGWCLGILIRIAFHEMWLKNQNADDDAE